MIMKLIVLVLILENIYLPTNGQDFFRQDYSLIEGTDNFYKVHTLHKNWEDAKAKCEAEGATLFYPEDDDEALAVIAHWNTTQPGFHWVFIGVADWNVREVFETIDGRPISSVFSNWGYGEPNNADGKEGCVVLRRDGTLNDENCENKYPFVCKKAAATVLWNKECNIPDIQYVYSDTLKRCYKFHLKPRNWSEAHAYCNAEESYLAVINSELERDYLVNLTASAPKDTVIDDFLPGGVHLGFQNKKGWVTVKGVPLHLSGYSRWGNQQPDGGSAETCGSMFYNGELNDIGCFQKMFFICEHEISIQSEIIGYKFGTDTSKTGSNASIEDSLKKVFGSPDPK